MADAAGLNPAARKSVRVRPPLPAPARIQHSARTSDGGPEMVEQVMVMVGTKKGAFVMESTAARTEWSVRGPYLEGQN